MRIGGLQKTTLIDYPGKVACTVFLLGCNFRCPWCYSSELVLPEKIKVHPKIPLGDFFSFLKKRQGQLEGVVICGGEPTTHPDLPDFCREIKGMNYLVKIDTNGSNPEMLKLLIDEGLVDYVAMDIKAPIGAKTQNSKLKTQNQSLKLKNKYDEAVGTKVDLDKIRRSVKIVKSSGKDYEFRTTVVPTIHTKEDILQIARDISPARRYYLQNFRPEKTLNPEFLKLKPLSEEELLRLKETIAPLFEVCAVR